MAFVVYRNLGDGVIITSEVSESACLAEHFSTTPDSGSRFAESDYDAFSAADQLRYPRRMYRYVRQLVTGSCVPMEAHTYTIL